MPNGIRESYRRLDPGVTAVALHPRFRERAMLLSAVMSDPDREVVYYPDARALGASFDPYHPRELARAALDGLAAPYALIIDESDEADPALLNALAPNVPPGSRLVLAGRALPDGVPWVQWEREGRAATLGVPPGARVEREGMDVSVFGPGTAYINGKIVTDWGGDLPRSLFFYILDRDGATRQEIFDVFWPGLSPRDATNVFHVTKHKLIEMVGVDMIEYRLGRYHFAGDVPLRYDAAVFEDLIAETAWCDDDARLVGLLEDAVALARAPFLTGCELEWAAERREDLRRAYGDALARLGLLRRGQGRNEEALGLLNRAVRELPFRDDLHEAIIRLHAERGEADAARAHFGFVEALLQRELNIAPSPAMRAAMEAVAA